VSATAGGSFATRALCRAIETRLRVREALDRDDMPAVATLNRAADEAYRYLGPAEAIAYLEWVRTDVPAVADLQLGAGDLT
jgi:hypothetical protein